MKLVQNVYSNEKTWSYCLFHFFSKVPDFSQFPDFSQKLAILGQLSIETDRGFKSLEFLSFKSKKDKYTMLGSQIYLSNKKIIFGQK